MCGGEFNPVGRWDDPNVCRSCLTNQFCAGPARSLELRGRPRGGPLAHNQVQPGATPGPATNLPAPCVTVTAATCERPPAGANPPPDQPRLRRVTSNPHPLVIPHNNAGPASVFTQAECDAVTEEWWKLLAAASHVRQSEILTNPTGQSARRLAHWATALAEARS